MEQSSQHHINWAQLITRVVIGLVFAAHGAQKLFDFGIPAITEGFASSGIPLPTFTAPLVTFVELLGGLALAAGAFTRIASILLAIDMLGAILFVHISSGFFLPTGYEFALILLLISVGFALSGAGAYSVDASRRKSISHVQKAVLA